MPTSHFCGIGKDRDSLASCRLLAPQVAHFQKSSWLTVTGQKQHWMAILLLMWIFTTLTLLMLSDYLTKTSISTTKSSVPHHRQSPESLLILPPWHCVIRNNYKTLLARGTYWETTAGSIFQPWRWQSQFEDLYPVACRLHPSLTERTNTLWLHMLNWLSLSPTSETEALFTLQNPAATRQSVLKQLELPPRVKVGEGEGNEREVSERGRERR